MTIKKTALMTSVSVAAIIAAQSAMAGGLAIEHPTSWQGLYVGLHAGTGEANFDGIFKSSDSAVIFDRIDASGVLGGAQIGYNWDNGNFVAGIEADISAMDWSGVAQAAESSEEAEGGVDLLASVRGRIGVPVGDDRDILLYGTAGIAFVAADVLVCDNACAAPTVSTQKISFDDIGGVVGAGFEFAATDEFRIRGETLYYWFDDNNRIALSEANAGDRAGLDDAWVVRIGGSWYFNTK